jgi:hypothetical protein
MDTSKILGPDGKLARDPRVPVTCPGCRTLSPPGDVKKRRLSGGFGALTDICRECGYAFDELTVPATARSF